MAESVSFTFDALSSNQGAEAPPSTPVVDQQAETMQMQSAQPAPSDDSRDCSAKHLFQDTPRANVRDRQAAEVTVLKALPECKEELLKGPHHSNSMQIREVQKFNDLTQNLAKVIDTAICGYDVALASIPGSIAACRSADKPPLRPMHHSLNHLAKNPVREDPVKDSSQRAVATKQAPPGGKPRKPRPSAQDELLCGGFGRGAPAVDDVSRLHPKSTMTQCQVHVCLLGKAFV